MDERGRKWCPLFSLSSRCFFRQRSHMSHDAKSSPSPPLRAPAISTPQKKQYRTSASACAEVQERYNSYLGFQTLNDDILLAATISGVWGNGWRYCCSFCSCSAGTDWLPACSSPARSSQFGKGKALTFCQLQEPDGPGELPRPGQATTHWKGYS